MGVAWLGGMIATSPNAAYTPLRLLLFVDLVLIVLHAIHVFSPVLNEPVYAITVDGGLGEHFQYLKALWIALAFLALSRLRADRRYWVWAGTFAYLMLDDAFLLHERAGIKFAALLDLPSVFGLRPDDLGELITALIVGGALFAALTVAYVRGTTGFRKASHATVGLLVLLAGFGIVADLGSVLAYGTLLQHPVSMLEDGGEMVVMSGIVDYTWRLLSAEIRMPSRIASEAAIPAGPSADDGPGFLDEEAGTRRHGARSRDDRLSG